MSLHNIYICNFCKKKEDAVFPFNTCFYVLIKIMTTEDIEQFKDIKQKYNQL